MEANGLARPSEPGRPLSRRAILIGGVLVGLVGAVAVAALLYFYGGGTEQDRVGLDVVRTAGTLVVGTGGAVALLLAARRQRYSELTLEHQREVADTAERDAVERRITELYTHAVDQLGNDKAPVRLGGLHALERLAQNNPDQRQVIVDVICAYLRMPYTLHDDKAPTEDVHAEAHARYEQRRQELQVRMTAQRILVAHLKPEATDKFWLDIDLDLSEAHLYSLDFSGSRIRNAQFIGSQFSGVAFFSGAHFDEDASFDRAQFGGAAWFGGAPTSFTAEQFTDYAIHGTAELHEDDLFRPTHFGGDAFFSAAHFSEDAFFGGVQFDGAAVFDEAQFSGHILFSGVEFGGVVRFDRARVVSDHAHLLPGGWDFDSARLVDGEEGDTMDDGEEAGWSYLVRIEDSVEQ
jgi:uncharacterized protein YjbI with pentapeptide repeats